MRHQVIISLGSEVRAVARLHQIRTPLLEQYAPEQTRYTILGTSIAATVESFYRSALNASLNYRLTGYRGALFPDMHLQVPARVVYINGFKMLRRFIDDAIVPDSYAYPNLARTGMAISPGLIMTPVSSLLEACNAGNMNPEPIYRRLTRGMAPRGLREVVFGVGLNQLSDFTTQRVPEQWTESPLLRSAMGSVAAGVAAGYLSHVPHNLSTMRLMQPNKPYRQIMHDLARQSPLFKFSGGAVRSEVALTAMAIVAPAGLAIRTTQIVGSFMILNGIISVFS